MNLCKADKFTEEEDQLMQELKLNCKNDGREIDPEISAPILHKLGTLYLQRSKICSTIDRMICLIRCAVLLNAALVRTTSNTDVIRQDLMQLNQHLLISADAEEKDIDLCKITEKVQLLIKEMRKHVNRILNKIPQVEAHESEDEMLHQELIKIVAIERLQNKITLDYTNIMAKLADDCRKIMGKVPCKFAIIGMGSLARKEITPFSDFEHVIVFDTQFNGQNEEILNYFRWYSVIFQIILIHLGETVIPSVLNYTNSKFGSWFFDDITKSGVSFDGTFPWASKYPLGRQQLTEDKDWKTELIKSVPDMLKYLNSKESLKNGYHLGDILTKICYVYGDESLFAEFQSGVNNILQSQNEDLRNEVLKQIIDDLENFSIRTVLLKITDKGNYHVKKDVYRVTTLFIAALGRLNKIATFSCFDIIRQLAETCVISNYTKHNLMYAIAIACEIRLRWYMINKKQKDDINCIDATTKFLEIIGERSAISYLQIAYTLQCDISKRLDLKKGHFYSHPDLLNISIYLSFQKNKHAKQYFNAFKINQKEQRLLDFDTCLKMLTTKQTTDSNKQTELSNKPTTEYVFYQKLYSMGKILYEMKKFIDAKEYLERALKIKQQMSKDVGTDKEVAYTYHEIGRCLIQMNRLTDARTCLEKALKIKKQISCDVAGDREVATTLAEIGRCLNRMNKLTDAKDYCQRALTILRRASNNIDTDREVAYILRELGRCLNQMNKLTDARKYLEKALEIKQRTSKDVTTDTQIAITLAEIGRCLIAMNKLTDAKNYFERVLDIKKRKSSDVTTDREVAYTLHDLGRCLIKMNKLTDARTYLERALEIEQLVSSDVAIDREVAITLAEIGRCLMQMNKLTDAKNYFERALKNKQRASSNIAIDREVAYTLHDLGQCLHQMNKLTDAKDYLERALEIKQRTSSDVSIDREVAHTLQEIGQCLIAMDKLTDAKDYLERALEIKQNSSIDVATDRKVAVTLCYIGRCLIKMNQFADAKGYLERALTIDQQTSGNVATDREVAIILAEIGRCLMQMNKLTDAKNYFERALQIKQSASSNIAIDREVAYTLRDLGQCLQQMNKLTDAKDYLERALEIKQRTSSDVSIDREVAHTLQEIGRCLIEMNTLTDAKDYLERALEIKQNSSIDVATDRKVAVTLYHIGRCLIKMNQFADAKGYLERALTIVQQTPGNVAIDREVAIILAEISRCLM